MEDIHEGHEVVAGGGARMAPTDFHLLTRHYQGLAQPVRVVVEPAVGGDAAVEHLVQPAGEGEDLAQGAADRGLAQAVAEAAQAEDGVGLAQAEPGEAGVQGADELLVEQQLGVPSATEPEPRTGVFHRGARRDRQGEKASGRSRCCSAISAGGREVPGSFVAKKTSRALLPNAHAARGSGEHVGEGGGSPSITLTRLSITPVESGGISERDPSTVARPPGQATQKGEDRLLPPPLRRQRLPLVTRKQAAASFGC